MLDSARLKGIFFGMTATAFWGSFYPASRFIFGEELEQADPVFIAFLRTVICFLSLLPFFWRGTDRIRFRKDWKRDWKLFLLMAISAQAESMLVFLATKYTTAARASLLANTAPIFTVVIAVLMVQESLNRWKAAGMILGFGGITLAALSRGMDRFTDGAGAWQGDLLALGSGICWALFTVLAGRIAERDYDSRFITCVTGGLGVILMIPVLFLLGCRPEFHLPLRAWLGLFYLGICAGSLANCCWCQALKYLQPGEAGSFGYVSAMMAVAFSTLFLGEKLSLAFLLAIPCVLGGIGLMFHRGKHA